jgi:hypothetical protein
MYLMYVDESGDPGILSTSPTKYFVLTGLVIHESSWSDYLQKLIQFRREMRVQYGLGIREEIHAGKMISGRTKPPMSFIPKHNRLAILRKYADLIGSMPSFNIINVVVDKSTKTVGYDVFESAWQALIQRFENTLDHGNFRPDAPKAENELGIILPDNTDGKKLTQLLRKMRYFNMVPNMRSTYHVGSRNLRIGKIIEDPYLKDSRDSYFIQTADLAAFLLYQAFTPCSYIRKQGAKKLFSILEPALCKHASSTNKWGIVLL